MTPGTNIPMCDAGSCAQIGGTYYYENRIIQPRTNDEFIYNIDNWETCSDHCQQEPRCDYWAWIDENYEQPNYQRTCILHTGKHGLTAEEPNVISGTKNCASEGARTIGNLQGDIRISNPVYENPSSRSEHCSMRNTMHECTQGSGPRLYNSGLFWDPALQWQGGVDPNWNCSPCCLEDGKTIRHCNANARLITPAVYETPSAPLSPTPEHCRMSRTSEQCVRGRGILYYNSGTVWDPTRTTYGGVDTEFNCSVCCQDAGKSIPVCDITATGILRHGIWRRIRGNY